MKKIILGLSLAFITIAGSAFTAFEPTGTLYGQQSSMIYSQRVGPFNSALCITSANRCAYVVTQAGEDSGITFGNLLSLTQINTYVSLGYFVFASSTNGLYTGA